MDWLGPAIGLISCARPVPAATNDISTKDADNTRKEANSLILLVAITPFVHTGEF
jgi:hypothetical protein